MEILSLHHVQLAMPQGKEDAARAFYRDVLGFKEVEKPPILAARGGVWFEKGTVHLHLGVEEAFRPARKAHPAFEVAGLEKLFVHLAANGVTVIDDDTLPGFVRGYVDDPFGNRIEFLESKE